MATETVKRPRAVNYDLVEYGDELPDQEPRAGRTSEHTRNMDKIKMDPSKHGKWYRIGAYRESGGAVTRKNKLVRDNGSSASINGWEFSTRKIDETHEETGDKLVRGLFAKYSPEEIVDGAWEQWQDHVAAKDAEVARQKGQAARVSNGADDE